MPNPVFVCLPVMGIGNKDVGSLRWVHRESSLIIVDKGSIIAEIMGSIKRRKNVRKGYLHLRTDADERVTMIQTYLALLRKGSGPKDDERQLIWQTFYREMLIDADKYSKIYAGKLPELW